MTPYNRLSNYLLRLDPDDESAIRQIVNAIVESEKKDSYLDGYSAGYKKAEEKIKKQVDQQKAVDSFPPGTRVFSHGGEPIALEPDAPDLFPWIHAIMSYESGIGITEALQEYRKRFKLKD